jgi:hypothetical protein
LLSPARRLSSSSGFSGEAKSRGAACFAAALRCGGGRGGRAAQRGLILYRAAA